MIVAADSRSQTDRLAGRHPATFDSINCFAELSPKELRVHPATLTQWQSIFWDSICTEYDARRLYWHVARKEPAVFRQLEQTLRPWLQDEIEHALGFQILYSRLYEDDPAAVGLRLETRGANFEHIEPFLGDGLSLLLLLAYDEIVTTHVYHRSIADYDAFGIDALSRWIRKLKNDETRHLFSFVDAARTLFSGRIPEAPDLMRSIVNADFRAGGYHGTFVLDHHSPEFPLSRYEIENLLVPAVLRRLNQP